MKVKLDENLPQDLKRLLLSLGYDVTDVVEEGLAGATDLPRSYGGRTSIHDF